MKLPPPQDSSLSSLDETSPLSPPKIHRFTHSYIYIFIYIYLYRESIEGIKALYAWPV
jgi:hypothetical protein